MKISILFIIILLSCSNNDVNSNNKDNKYCGYFININSVNKTIKSPSNLNIYLLPDSCYNDYKIGSKVYERFFRDYFLYRDWYILYKYIVNFQVSKNNLNDSIIVVEVVRYGNIDHINSKNITNIDIIRFYKGIIEEYNKKYPLNIHCPLRGIAIGQLDIYKDHFE